MRVVWRSGLKFGVAAEDRSCWRDCSHGFLLGDHLLLLKIYRYTMASFQEMINDETPLLVDFSAEWCGPCKMMAPILKEVAGQMGEAVRIIKVDVDKNPQAAAAYQIQGVPTLILFQKGKQLWRQSGVVAAAQLTQIIRAQTA